MARFDANSADLENFISTNDDFWDDSKITSNFDFDLSFGDGSLKCEIDNEFDAEFLSLEPAKAEGVQNKPKNPVSSSASCAAPSKSGVQVMSSMFPDKNVPPLIAIAKVEKPKPALKPIVNRAADYSKKVSQNVTEKTADQKFLEEERCNLLLEEFSRSLFHSNPPKISLRPDEVVRKLSSSQKISDEVVLEVFRSLSQKRQLLEKACLHGDGNCITRIVLFLRKSLSDSVFRRLVQHYPIALNHLVVFYKASGDLQSLERLYKLFDRNSELLFLLLRKANNESNPNTKLAALQTIFNRIQSTTLDSKLKLIATQLDAELINESILLLDAQLRISTVNDTCEKKKTNLILLNYPLTSPITSHSVISTAYHCDFYHPNSSLGEVNNSDFIRKTFKLTEKQYQWPFITAKARLRQWAPIETALTQKSLFGIGIGNLGANRSSCAIGYDNLARVLVEQEAPADVIAKHLMQVRNVEERLSIASSVQCQLVFVMTYIEQRNRVELLRLKDRLTPGSKEMHELQKALENSSIKWKN